MHLKSPQKWKEASNHFWLKWWVSLSLEFVCQFFWIHFKEFRSFRSKLQEFDITTFDESRSKRKSKKYPQVLNLKSYRLSKTTSTVSEVPMTNRFSLSLTLFPRPLFSLSKIIPFHFSLTIVAGKSGWIGLKKISRINSQLFIGNFFPSFLHANSYFGWLARRRYFVTFTIICSQFDIFPPISLFISLNFREIAQILLFSEVLI